MNDDRLVALTVVSIVLVAVFIAVIAGATVAYLLSLL